MTEQVSDQEMVTVIADFLEQGLVENIISMFKADTSYYSLVGELLKDERFMVRLGVSVLFEEMSRSRPRDAELAVPVLLPLLSSSTPAYVRGDAANILGIIGSEQALKALEPLIDDEDPQVSEIARDFVSKSS